MSNKQSHASISPKTFSIESFVTPGYSPILSAVAVVANDKGELSKADGDKWSQVADLAKLTGKFGPFLMNPMEEADRETHDTYFIGEVKPENRGAKKPSAILRVKKAGAEETEFVCGLFLRTYDDGSNALIGTDKEAMVRYGIFLNEIKETAEKVAVNG